jgi:hypothetical protein
MSEVFHVFDDRLGKVEKENAGDDGWAAEFAITNGYERDAIEITLSRGSGPLGETTAALACSRRVG